MITAGFIGCGNMGGALCRSVAKAIGGENIYASDFISEKATILCESIGATPSSNEEISKYCKYIFLGVKPQVIEATLREIAPVLKKRKDDFTLVSMAAGISTDVILKTLGFNCPLVRIMPNTPVSVGKGIVAYCCNELVEKEALEDWLGDMSFCGLVDGCSGYSKLLRKLLP